MYAVGFFNRPQAMPHGIYPNVFPDFDLAYDCVVSEVQQDYPGDDLHPIFTLGGTQVFKCGESLYIIGKLFNFNPRGL